MKYAFVLFALGCLVTAAAQQWQVEFVDASCRPGAVFVGRDSARTYAAYITAAGGIRIAAKDTAWRYEDLDTGLVHPLLDLDNDFHFALGPDGMMAVSGVDDSFRPVVVMKSESGWARAWTRAQLPYFSSLARAVFGADPVPAIIYCDGNEIGTSAYVIVETWQDPAWQADTAERFEPQTQFVELTLYDADCSVDAGPSFLIYYGHGLPKCGQSPWWIEVDKGYRSGAGWSLAGLGGGTDAVVHGYDIVSGGPDSASAAVYSNGNTMFDHDVVCGGRVTDAAVQVDSAGRALIAYVTSDGALRFAYKDTRWHYREVPGVTTATCCDLALDGAGQPLIGFEDGSGLWLAHGQDMLGISDNPGPQAVSRRPEPTVLSQSSVQSLKSSVLFDALGRRAADPKPGVYFVLDAQAQAQARAVRKVVVTR
jgi:hypothetical protein